MAVNFLRKVGLWVFLILAVGCSNYSTYTECKVVEEQKGASSGTAREYCQKLVDAKKIECDSAWCK